MEQAMEVREEFRVDDGVQSRGEEAKQSRRMQGEKGG
jgi:hypothetical protein